MSSLFRHITPLFFLVAILANIATQVTAMGCSEEISKTELEIQKELEEEGADAVDCHLSDYYLRDLDLFKWAEYSFLLPKFYLIKLYNELVIIRLDRPPRWI